MSQQAEGSLGSWGQQAFQGQIAPSLPTPETAAPCRVPSGGGSPLPSPKRPVLLSEPGLPSSPGAQQLTFPPASAKTSLSCVLVVSREEGCKAKAISAGLQGHAGPHRKLERWGGAELGGAEEGKQG